MNESPLAYDDVYARSYGRLVGQLTLITGSAHEAQDAVQEALFRAWLRWDKIGAYADPEGWIRRVAINLATSRWRKLRRFVPLPAEAPTVAPPPMAADGDGPTGVEGVADVLDLLAAIAQIPRREREALVLFYLADLSVQEVAHSMSIRLGTAKAFLSRGRQHLWELLSPMEKQPATERKGRTDVR
jgi:RNA polymerase sigma-70 factor (ECF subfamily)